MVNILLTSESRYPVNRKALKQAVIELLNEQKIKSPVEVSILIIGDRKMRELNKKYMKEEGTTDVLSFPLENNYCHSELACLPARQACLPARQVSGSRNKFGMTSNKRMPNQVRYGTKLGFINPPDNILRLGDVVISFPCAVKQAAENNLLVDTEICNLVKHGLLHLLGINHP